MKMGTGGVAGLAGGTDLPTGRNTLSLPYKKILHMGVDGFIPIRMKNPDIVAIAGMALRQPHHAVGCRQNRRSLRRRKIHTGMKFLGKPAHRIGARAITGGP